MTTGSDSSLVVIAHGFANWASGAFPLQQFAIACNVAILFRSFATICAHYDFG